MKANLNTPSWNKQNCSIEGQGVLIETERVGEPHSVYMELLNHLAPDTSQAVLQAVVRPLERSICWLGARANNKEFMACFDLNSGTILGRGAHVTDHSIIPYDDGSFECRVLFDGSFPDTNAAFGIGAAVEDMEEDYVGQNGLHVIEVLEYYFAEGIDYDPKLGDKPQDALHFVRTGDAPLSFAGVAYETDAFTAACAVSWDGNEEEKNLLQHWSEVDQECSWRLFVNPSGKPAVELSNDGSTIIKRYELNLTLPQDNLCLVSFSWDGTALQFFINDVQLNKDQFEAIIDNDFNGKLHSSSAAIEAIKSVTDTPFKHWLWSDLKDLEEIAKEAELLGLKGMPNGSSGEVTLIDPPSPTPTLTLSDTIQWLLNKGVVLEDIHYVDNLEGNNGNNGKAASSAWRTIQHAANVLKTGQAVIIRGRGGRFYEQITPKQSGKAGQHIWYVGDPENPPIIDSSEAFDVSWTDRGNGMYSAPYNRTRYFNEEVAFFRSCTANHCRPASTFMSHQLIFADRQLSRVNVDAQNQAPSSLEQGECYFKTSGLTDNDFRTPKEVWCRLPGNANPNKETMRIASDKKYLFDYSAYTWVEGFPGGTKKDRAKGRDHIGLVNLHFKFGGLLRKVGPVNIRGRGWHVERCSFSDSNCEAASFYGDDHKIINCKFINFGKGLKGDELQNGSGTTLFSKCLFENGNLHKYPEAWEAGFKMSDCGHGGSIIWQDCLFKDIDASGLWWDINCGGNNPTKEAFIVRRCVFEKCARHAIFPENNTYYVIVEHSAVWNTQYSKSGNSAQELASGIRIAGSGLNTIRNSAFVYNQGKGIYNKVGSDKRATKLGGNQNTIINNVVLQNAREPRIDIQRVEHFGGDDSGPKKKAWSSSTIKNNVYFGDLHSKYFCEDNGSGMTTNDSISWFQDGSRTGGSGNVIAKSATDIVEDFEDRKKFFVTATGLFPDKGPTELIHYKDLPGTNWNIPK